MDLLNGNIVSILILLFLIVTFLQSGIDKIFDWNGNLGFIKEHFKDSPLKNMVPLLLGQILVMEVAAGVIMLIGAFQLATSGAQEMAFYGLALSALSLIFLLIGQRLAKDYAGAMTLAVYFTINILGFLALA
jgi:putative oxidoreductase